MAYYDLNLQRKQEIENNLLALMQEVPYDRIYVKDLTDNMQIARKTFYHYFHNKQSCLESLIDRMIQESNLVLLALPKNAAQQDIHTEHLRFWIRNKAFLEAVRRNGLGTLFTQRIIQYVRQEDSSLPSRFNFSSLCCDGDVLYYCISGLVCLMLKWCQEDFARPLEEMVQITLQILQKPPLVQRTE